MPASLAELLEMLETGDEYRRMDACRALGERGDVAALPALLEALGSGDEWVAEEAAMALGRIASPDAVPGLLGALGCQDRTGFLAEVTESIGESANPSHAALAGAQLALDTGAVRAAAARALGSIGDPSAVEGLVAALRDEHLTAPREAAAEALESLGTPEALAALAAWRGDS